VEAQAGYPVSFHQSINGLNRQERVGNKKSATADGGGAFSFGGSSHPEGFQLIKHFMANDSVLRAIEVVGGQILVNSRRIIFPVGHLRGCSRGILTVDPGFE